VSSLPIEFLCRHFALGGFDCGNETLNAGLESRLANLPDPDEATVLVAHDAGIIRGYAAVCNLMLALEDRDEDPKRCFFIAALAVDNTWQGSDLGPELMSKCYGLKRQRGRRSKFAATVVTSLFDDQLETRYRKMRFKPVAENPLLWYRLSSA